MPHRQHFNSSSAIIKFEFDFTQKEWYISYYGYVDVASYLGGLNGFVNLIMDLSTPIMMLLFLKELAEIILEKYQKRYEKQLASILKDFHQKNR